jgi:hypothetical protein
MSFITNFTRSDKFVLPSFTPPQETTHLLRPTVSKRGDCNRLTVPFTVFAICTVVIVLKSFSGSAAGIEPVGQSQDLSSWTPIKLPENIYELPMNESCQEKYLDHSSNNLCRTVHNLCQEYNCPREAMPQFSTDATVLGFMSLQENVSSEYIPAKEIHICQGEVFKIKVKYDIDRITKYPIPGEIAPCGEEGRIYPISAEGCALDGNHDCVGCMFCEKSIRVRRMILTFFAAVEKSKAYIAGCKNRTLPSKICLLE